MTSIQTAAVDRTLGAKKLKMQSRADWDALKLDPATQQPVTEDQRAAIDVGAEEARRFASRLKSLTGVTAKTNILPPDALPRATHKVNRIEDRRLNVWS